LHVVAEPFRAGIHAFGILCADVLAALVAQFELLLYQ
jgi:hypothetical protein